MKKNSSHSTFRCCARRIGYIGVLSFLLLYRIHDASGQQIALGGRHSIAICSDSTVRTWGYNGYGQLGNNSISESHTPTTINGLNKIVKVAGGLFHSLFLKDDGSVWACGRNTVGQLGDGTTTERHTPVQVAGLSGIVDMAGGGEHSVFVKNDGTVWACGLNSSRQLGDGTTTSKSTPVQVTALSNVKAVAAGAEFTLFLKNDGTVWACGHNGYGQYGNGTNTTSTNPVQVNSLSNIVQLSAGEWHSVFVKNDGTVLSCGRNNYGQLGNGTLTDNNTASQVTTLSGIIKAEAGGIHTVFVKNDGTAWACGLNSGGNNDGQLGDGTIIDKSTPVQVIANWGTVKITDAHAAREHSIYFSDSGEIWASGRNNYGQLGYGQFTTGNSNTPVKTIFDCGVVVTINDAQPGFEKIDIFPNPSSGSITIRKPVQCSSVRITDINGTVLKTYTGHNTEINEHSLHGLSGLYFIILYGDKEVVRKSVMFINNK